MQEVISSYLQAMGATPQNIEERILNISIRLNNDSSIKIIDQPTIVFSDIHGNFPALQAMFAYAKTNDICRFISLGDMMDYNPYEFEVLQEIFSNKESFISILKGNHDTFKFKIIENQKNDTNSIFQKFGSVLPNLPDFDIIQLKNAKILLCHSNPLSLDPLYLLDNGQVFNDHLFEFFFKKIDIDGFFYGHSHFVTFKKSKFNNRFAFNPGSLGVPRDGSNKLTFSLIKPETLELNIFSFQHHPREKTELVNQIPELIENFKLS